MVARDDSVIRGSLITCLIFLVLSLALNFILWRWGDTQAQSADQAASSLSNAQNEIRGLNERSDIYKAMLGIGTLSQSQFDSMGTDDFGDQDLNTIAKQFHTHMKIFGADVEIQDKTYSKMPEFFTDAVRRLNTLYADTRQETEQVRSEAKSDVDIARNAQTNAEKERDDTQKQLENERDSFKKDRDRINQEREQDRDKVTSISRDFDAFRRKSQETTKKLTASVEKAKNTIETQRIKLNELTSEKFESVQGEIRFVRRGGKVCNINLGSADALRPGITFGVIDRNDRLEDADIKATIQVSKILGQHLAEANVLTHSGISEPIIEGDYVYSPFWAPGRHVKIALAGDIDLDGDNKPDNNELKGMIQAAGAKIAVEFMSTGVVTGKLDSDVRFMVIGEAPNLEGANADRNAAQVAALGRARNEARAQGVTIIPAWKLQAYLKRLDNTLTTPLGSAAREEDFPLERPDRTMSRLPATLPSIYTNPPQNIQEGNEIKP